MRSEDLLVAYKLGAFATIRKAETRIGELSNASPTPIRLELIRHAFREVGILLNSDLDPGERGRFMELGFWRYRNIQKPINP